MQSFGFYAPVGFTPLCARRTPLSVYRCNCGRHNGSHIHPRSGLICAGPRWLWPGDPYQRSSGVQEVQAGSHELLKSVFLGKLRHAFIRILRKEDPHIAAAHPVEPIDIFPNVGHCCFEPAIVELAFEAGDHASIGRGDNVSHAVLDSRDHFPRAWTWCFAFLRRWHISTPH